MRNLRQKSIYGFLAIVFVFAFHLCTHAEGSRDLFPNGAKGDRAYLLSSTTEGNFNPFATPGTVKVYVKAGETVYLGSSVIGKRWPSTTGPYPKIIIRTPNGKKYELAGDAQTVGLIQDRTQELNGPNRSGVTNGYNPLKRVVAEEEEGIWEIDFEALGTQTNIPSPSTSPHPTGTYFGITYSSTFDANFKADDNWVQPLAYNNIGIALIAAWDISVGSASNASQLISGRIFTTLYAGTVPNAKFDKTSFYSNFYVLTPEGNAYLVENNGQNGASFNFFSNNKGAVTSLNNGAPIYKSINTTTFTALQTQIWDPRLPDEQGNVTNKLFFNKPSSDLPNTAVEYYRNGTITSTWLKTSPVIPSISNLQIFGRESEEASNVVGPKGAIISFESNVDGLYRIMLDINNNGKYDDDVDVIITGHATGNKTNFVHWDGRDGKGNFIEKGTVISIRGSVSISEVHFPYSDVESNLEGIIIFQLDEKFEKIPEKDIVYWDDTPITGVTVGTSNPIQNIVLGQSSSVNGHKWGVTTSNLEASQYGNNKTLDTWTFTESQAIIITQPMDVFFLDLAVNKITPNKNSISLCGDTVIYQVEIENKYSDTTNLHAYGAKFEFTVPKGLQIVQVNYEATNGKSEIIPVSEYITNGEYGTFLNIDNRAKGVFSIVCRATTQLYNLSNIPVQAAIIRPADHFDVDATDTTFNLIGKLHADIECNGAPSGEGCNNIKNNDQVTTIFCATASLAKTSDLNRMFRNGDTITYTITYKNLDPFEHTGVQIYDTLPEGLQLVSGSIEAHTLMPYLSYEQTVYNTKGTFTFIVPNQVGSITVKAWGAGGGGGLRAANNQGGGGGGGGGAYAQSQLSVNEGSKYSVVVGTGGAIYNAGGDSYFRLSTNATNLVLAKGGAGAGNNTNTGAAGGSATNSIGQIRYAGGNGATGNGTYAGGGGSSANPFGNGVNATNRNGAQIDSLGGNGGMGAGNTTTLKSTTGNPLGGGGGGAYRVTSTSIRTASAGGDGQIIIEYLINKNPGTVGTFPHIAKNWSVNAEDVLIVTYKAVVESSFTGDIIKNIATAKADQIPQPIQDSVTNYRHITITGNVYNDANGLSDNTVNGVGIGDPSGQNILVYLIDAKNEIIQVVTAAKDGNFQFKNVIEGNYSILISTLFDSEGKNSSVDVVLPPNWVNIGEHHGEGEGHDEKVDGRVEFQITYTPIDPVKLGINYIPEADYKYYTVDHSAFIYEVPNEFPAPNKFENFVAIFSSSSHLTGNGLGGLLTGKDHEDCPDILSCNAGSTFYIDTINSNTELYYKFGENDIRQLNDGDVIPNYNAENLLIYALEGSGKINDPIGFTYQLQDRAGFFSQPVEYWIFNDQPLSVSLSNFYAQIKDCQVHLHWSTDSEYLNESFTIEKSFDAKEWFVIDIISGQGTSNTTLHYYWKDDEVFSSTSYYRLRMKDITGYLQYSNIISIQKGACQAKDTVKLYPNPAQSIVFIEGNFKSEIEISVYNSKGILVIPIQTYLESGIDISQLNDGYYFLQIQSREKNHVLPFTILK